MANNQQTDDEFVQECDELGKKIIDMLGNATNMAVVVTTLSGVLAATMRAYDMPREMVIEMIDKALEDIDAK